MTCREEFENEIREQAYADMRKYPQLRLGQAIFNAVDGMYHWLGTARKVQFDHNIDCFFVRDPESPEIPKFIDKCYEVTVEAIKEETKNEEPLTYKGPVLLVPVLPASMYKEFYIPYIVKIGGIPKDKLEEGAWYHCNGDVRAQWLNGLFDYQVGDSRGVARHFEDALETEDPIVIPVEKE